MSVEIFCGDALDQLRRLEGESVNCCVTSPPYWGLRNYGVAGQFGLEATPEEYVAKLVAVFDEVRRVLRDDGTLWLNLGDCYATGAGKVGNCPGGGEQGARWRGDVDRVGKGKRGYRGERLVNTNSGKVTRPKTSGIGPMTQPNRMPIPGLKPKDLVGIPWRVAFALQAAGWWLRLDIIWAKSNPMPESIRDRPTKAHEYIFLMAKSQRYYFDADAIKEPYSNGVEAATPWAASGGVRNVGGRSDGLTRGTAPSWIAAEGGRNARSVWTIATEPFPEAHFATFPTELARRCILAGCPKGGTVVDPFFGAGTVGLVADRLDRSAIGIELNPEYVEIARRRIHNDAPLFAGGFET